MPTAVGNAAYHRVQRILSGWLVGFETQLRPALLQTKEWLEDSISRQEKFGDAPHFSAALRSEAYGLCQWMIEGANCTDAYREALTSYDLHFQNEGKRLKKGPKFQFNKETQRFEDDYVRGVPFENREILRGSLADYLANCIQCEEFEKGAALYERIGGKTDLLDSRVQTDIHFGYWVCREGTRGSSRTDEYRKIGTRVLRANLQGNWLNHGQYARAAQWLKIVFWHPDKNLHPLEVILKAYELMPDVPRPAFV